MRWRTRGALAAVILAGAGTAGLVALAAVAPAADIQLSSRTSVARDRVDLAAREAIDRYSEWLSPAPASTLTVREAASWRIVAPAMNVEMHVAYEIARQWFGRTDSVAVNAIAWYLQSRVVERLYDYAYHQPGHSGEVVWLFGRTVPVGFPSLRLSRSTKVLGRFDDQRWPDTNPELPLSVDRTVLRASLALASLERLAGWPALQGALREAHRQSASRALSLDELGQILATSMGIEHATEILEWYQRDEPVDYAISSVLRAACERADCVRTMVTLDSRGGAPPLPLTLRVQFSDGQHVDTSWDGQASQSFSFESGSAVSAVHLDPARIVLRDNNWLNNDRLAVPSTNVPLRKWTARWMVWLQDAMLAYSAGL